MTYYYTIALDGREVDTGTAHRGYTRRYRSLRTLTRYFLDTYAKDVYAQWVRGEIVADRVSVNVYGVSANDVYNPRAYRKIREIVI